MINTYPLVSITILQQKATPPDTPPPPPAQSNPTSIIIIAIIFSLPFMLLHLCSRLFRSQQLLLIFSHFLFLLVHLSFAVSLIRITTPLPTPLPHALGQLIGMISYRIICSLQDEQNYAFLIAVFHSQLSYIFSFLQ